MNEQLGKQTRKNLERKTSVELKQIYKQHNEDVWSEEAFKVIHEILVSRREIVPHIESHHKREHKKEMKLTKFIKDFPKKDVHLPKVWPGYLFALVIFFLSIQAVPFIDVVIKNGKFPSFAEVPIAILLLALFIVFSIISVFYWFQSVYRFHLVLKQITNDAYPISPWQAALFHFIPVFWYYWIFKWTKGITVVLNDKWIALVPYVGRDIVERKKRNKYFISIVFLLAVILETWIAFNLLFVNAWQEAIIAAILFMFLFYGILHVIKVRVKRAYILNSWQKNQVSQL